MTNTNHWTIAGGVLLALFAYVHLTATRSPPPPKRAEPIENDATRRGQPAWMAGEHYRVDNRKYAREGALKGLDQPWASYCGEGRRKLLSGLGYYLERRGAEQIRPNPDWGESWARHVKTVWATADDARIERLALSAYASGYFSIDDLGTSVRTAAVEMFGKERVRGRACG